MGCSRLQFLRFATQFPLCGGLDPAALIATTMGAHAILKPWATDPLGYRTHVGITSRLDAIDRVYFLFCTAHVAPHAPSNACTAPVVILEQELWFMNYFSRMRLKISHASS